GHPLDEERDRRHLGEVLERRQVVEVGQLERRDRELLFAAQVQRRPGGDEGFEARRGREQLGDQRRRRDDLLEVVQDQEERLVAQVRLERFDDRLLTGLAHAQRLGDRRGDERLVADWRQRHEVRAVLELVD